MRLTCSVPPSTNNLFVTRRDGKGRARSSAYKAWQNAAAWEIHVQMMQKIGLVGPIKGPVAVLIEVPFNRQRDIDNIKPLLDILKGLVIEDDRWVDDLRIVRVSPKEAEKVAISIWKL